MSFKQLLQLIMILLKAATGVMVSLEIVVGVTIIIAYGAYRINACGD